MRSMLCQLFGTVLNQYCAGLLLIFKYENARFSTYITIFVLRPNWNNAIKKKNIKHNHVVL